jgi:hypothetical protein
MSYEPPMGQPALPPDVNSKKILAGIMGIILGGLGIHRFILGDTSGGIIRIVITVLTWNRLHHRLDRGHHLPHQV